MSKQPLKIKIRDAIIDVAKKLKIHPSSITRSQLINNSDVSDWALRKVKLTDVKKLYFPITDKELSVESDAKITASYIRKLEKQVGEAHLLESKLLAAIDRRITPIEVTPYKPSTRPKYKGKREIVCMLNDVHYGLNVVSDEVGGVNQFNWTIAARRTAHFINEVCDYKRYKRDTTDKIHLIVNGDIIAGVIHGLLGRDLDLLVHQINGAIHIFVHGIKVLAENFKQVEVHWEIGNHGDMVHRREGGRVSSQVKDNYESLILYAVSVAFRNTPTVRFHTNNGLYGVVDLPAGRLMFTHGHLLFSKELGNPGTKVNTRILSDAIMRFNNGELSKNNPPAKMVWLGHTHSQFSFTTPDGTLVYNAPSLSGVDAYAFSLGINHNLVAQIVCESTDKHIFGDSRLIHLQEADNKSELDRIIPPYNRELVWNG